MKREDGRNLDQKKSANALKGGLHMSTTLTQLEKNINDE